MHVTHSELDENKVDRLDFARQGERSKEKAVLHLKGVRKPVVCNKTNANNLAEKYGKGGVGFVEWIGKRVTVKAEPTTFGGKRVMGLRLYPANAENTPALKEPKKSTLSDEMNDDLPDDL
jgi:hypothetical protein